MRVAGDWARRAPLLPALIFMIIVTQLPFVGTLVISFMNWNAYYPDQHRVHRGDQLRRGLHRRRHPSAIITTVVLTVVGGAGQPACSGLVIALLLDRRSSAGASCAR